MNCWFQESNFESTDLIFDDAASAKKYWSQLDFESLDADQKKLTEEKSDYCPWGFGLGFDSDLSMHIYRDNPNSQYFEILINQTKAHKILGITISKKSVEQIHRFISKIKVDEFFDRFFNSDDSLLSKTERS